MISFTCGLKRNELVCKPETNAQTFENELVVSGGEEVGERDSQGAWDGHVQSAVFKMDSQQGHVVPHMELCSWICGILDERGVWGPMDTCVFMAESLGCSPETHKVVC